MDGFAASNPEAGVRRRPGWYDRLSSGINGGIEGTSGGRFSHLCRAYLAIASFIVLSDIINVLSILHEVAGAGRTLAAWIPFTTEFTSGVGALIASGLVYLAMRFAPPGRAPWLLKAPVHVAATVVFSTVHVAVMMGLRIAVFATHGHTYHPPVPGDLIYEYRKDLLSYVIIAGIFWLFRAPGLRAAPRSMEGGPDETPLMPGHETFDIVDGAKTLRVPVGQILAVRAVRNYVEFLLEDGRTPLMRASLWKIESALASHGLVRTHRSWLINSSRLRSLEATGTGDYRLELEGNVHAPLSRRFPAALERLRRGELNQDCSHC